MGFGQKLKLNLDDRTHLLSKSVHQFCLADMGHPCWTATECPPSCNSSLLVPCWLSARTKFKGGGGGGGAKDNRPLVFKTISHCSYCSFCCFFENFRGAKVVLGGGAPCSRKPAWKLLRRLIYCFSCSLIGWSWIISKVEWDVVFQTFFRAIFVPP